MRNLRLWLALLASAPAAAAAQSPVAASAQIPDPSTVQVPNLVSGSDVERNGYKFFVFRKQGVDFTTAAHDIAECRSFLASGAARDLPSFVPWVEAVSRPVENNGIIYSPNGELSNFIEGTMKAAMAAIILPKMERGLRNNKMRRCMEPRGYQRFAVAEAAWNEMNEGTNELKMILTQARIASTNTPSLAEVREKGE